MSKMDNHPEERCRICFTDNKIIDSNCYIKYFIQITGFKTESNELWLCIWCNATLKRTIKLIKLTLDKEMKLSSDNMLTKETKNLYNLSYNHNKHIDIPPLCSEDVNVNIKNDELNFEIQELHFEELSKDDEFHSNDLRNLGIIVDAIPELNNTKEINDKRTKVRDAKELDCNEKFMKRNNTNLKYNELQFEIKYLNIEEQLKEVELKKEMNSKMKFLCDDCGACFLTVDLFEDHKLRHSEVTGHTCKICKLRFKSSDVFAHHTLSHKRRFQCLLCNATFKQWSYCIAHRYKCGGVATPASCVQCLKIFSDEHSLNVHIKGVHAIVKKYVCEQCDKRFASKQRLTVHMRSHTGLKPFTCSQCHRSFTTNSNLRAHSSVHDGGTTHYCVECNIHYKSAKSLVRHLRSSSRHMDTTTYSCKVCCKQFPTEKSLQNHIDIRHNTTYRCIQCHKTFSNNTNLNKHMKCVHATK